MLLLMPMLMLIENQLIIHIHVCEPHACVRMIARIYLVYSSINKLECF